MPVELGADDVKVRNACAWTGDSSALETGEAVPEGECRDYSREWY